eukprot:6738107-Prymnesium_polylepis.1
MPKTPKMSISGSTVGPRIDQKAVSPFGKRRAGRGATSGRAELRPYRLPRRLPKHPSGPGTTPPDQTP